MPSTNQYDARRAVYVKPFSSSSILYGFLTNVRATIGTLAGHTNVPAQTPANLVFGANAPKPGRVTIRPEAEADQYDSTFYDFSKYAALKAGRNQVSNPKIRRGRVGSRSRTVFVTIGADADGNGTIKYAWNMQIGLYTRLGGDRAKLGIKDADGSERDLVWGLSSPRPPKAKKGQNSTFYDPSVTELPTGWSGAGTTGGEQVSPGS